MQSAIGKDGDVAVDLVDKREPSLRRGGHSKRCSGDMQETGRGL
jgi:hypothetical protein